MTAVARALHREDPPPWVLDDPIGLALAGASGEEMRDRLVSRLEPKSLRAFSRWCCVRSRFPEDLVEQELAASGICQYVVLGAGLDTFAERRRDVLRKVRLFEVDHPASQRWKRERLSSLGIDVDPNLVFAPVDFERQRLGEELVRAGFDMASPAVFSWIGVTMFLTRAAIASTLDVVAACAAGTRIVLTYNKPYEVLTPLGAETQAILGQMVEEMNEPLVSLFTPAQIEDLMRERGLQEFVHIGPDEARSLYFQDRPDVVLGGAQALIAATVGASRVES
ncbi:MAG TPA: class I SAM-dependent methyltransferase [Acidimicrobiales bacterium]|nr:class I SAM-dependent methyltransferase [Acidimicrobiales bacterium]